METKLLTRLNKTAGLGRDETVKLSSLSSFVFSKVESCCGKPVERDDYTRDFMAGGSWNDAEPP